MHKKRKETSVNENLKKREYRDGKKGGRLDRDGWMDVAMVITCEPY